MSSTSAMNEPLIKKVFFSLLIPTLMTNLVTSIGASADSIIVGNFVGDAALAAITLTFPVFMFINTLSALVAVGGSVVMSVCRGRGDQEETCVVFSNAIFTALGMGISVAVVASVFIGPIVHALGARGDGVGLLIDYAGVILLATPLFILNTCLAFFIRNEGRPVLAMVSMLTGILVNIVLNLLFVGSMGMGVGGAAWATDLSQVACLAILLSHFWSPTNRLGLRWSFSFGCLGQIIGSGIGTSLDFIYQAMAIFLLNNFIIGIAGSDGIVVYTVILNTGLFALSFFEGLSQTMQPMVSVFHGEENPRAIRASMGLACRTALVGSVAGIVFFELFPGALATAFGLRGGAAFGQAVTATRIYAPGIILMTFNVLMSYYYQSIERPRFSAVIVACRSLVFLLAGAILLGSLFGLQGVWWGIIASEASTLGLWTYWVHRSRKPGQSLLLLDPDDESSVFDERFVGTAENIHDALTRISAFLANNNVLPDRAAKVMLAVDELATNLVSHDSSGRARNLEVRVVVKGGVLLLIRDDGYRFDPSAFTAEVQPGIMGGKGLFLVKNMASHFEYRPVFGLNRTLLKF